MIIFILCNRTFKPSYTIERLIEIISLTFDNYYQTFSSMLNIKAAKTQFLKLNNIFNFCLYQNISQLIKINLVVNFKVNIICVNIYT